MPRRIYLEDIVRRKRTKVKACNFDREELMNKSTDIKDMPSFYKTIEKDGLSIIGEIKKASPSKGIIKECFNPIEIARDYEKSVDAISVLTEEDFFLGKDKYLQKVSQQITLPTLCKDFIIDSSQIYNAKALGASCILLIVAILTERQLVEFIIITHSLGMDALVEVHTKQEIERAIKSGAKIIGINNRNLKTFHTDISVTLNLRKYIPEDILVISESGIQSIDDIRRLSEVKINGILVGESFMKSDNIVNYAEAMKNAYT